MHAIIKWLFSHASVRQPTIFATNTKKDLFNCRILCWRTYKLFFAILFPERGDITKKPESEDIMQNMSSLSGLMLYSGFCLLLWYVALFLCSVAVPLNGQILCPHPSICRSRAMYFPRMSNSKLTVVPTSIAQKLVFAMV